jgi:MFS family permease
MDNAVKSDPAPAAPPERGRKLPRTVIALGLVSFFTDFSSEMIYPLLPLFLGSVLGAGALALGLIEGIAESTAAVLKLFSGIWTDRSRRRKPLIVFGYGLAGAVRPLIGLAATWPFVLAMRFLDRVGKGLRTSPRDALIADATPTDIRGRAYGFHRAMDYAGAVVGPLAAAGLLSLGGVTLRHVFLMAAVPAAVVILVLVAGVKEGRPGAAGSPRAVRAREDWSELGGNFRFLLAAVFVFTLGNSTDAFLLLSLAEARVPAAWVAVLWSLHHAVKMAATYCGGVLSDRFRSRRLILAGWTVYALVYLGFGTLQSAPMRITLFMVYGLYFGLTEPAEKAWISRLVPERLRGTAFGYFNGVIGIGALPASLIFGYLWQSFGSAAAFMTGAALALLASSLLAAWGRTTINVGNK